MIAPQGPVRCGRRSARRADRADVLELRASEAAGTLDSTEKSVTLAGDQVSTVTRFRYEAPPRTFGLAPELPAEPARCCRVDTVDQASPPLAAGGPASSLGTYSSSWMRPSKVRLLVMSSATSG